MGDRYCGGGLGDFEQGQQRRTPCCSSRGWRACMGERARLAIQPASASDLCDVRCKMFWKKKDSLLRSFNCLEWSRDRGRKGWKEISTAATIQRPLTGAEADFLLRFLPCGLD
jgi:hypothetical protein